MDEPNDKKPKKPRKGMAGRIGDYNASLTQEERKRRASEAGKRSAEVRKARSTMREDAVAILSAVIKKPELAKALSQLGIEDKNPTIQRAILAGQAISAIKGNTKAAEYLRDTCGEKPVERTENLNDIPNIMLGIVPVRKPETEEEGGN